MKTISIRDLHLETGRWIRHAARKEPLIITDRGQRVAVVRPLDELFAGARLPDRRAKILRRPRIPVDSAVYQSEMRDDR